MTTDRQEAEERYDVSLDAVPVSVRRARRACAELALRCGAAARADDIALCVSEAVTNVVRHAYPRPTPAGSVHLSVRLDDDGVLRVVVADDGVGLQRSRSSGGIGRGLAIMDQLADELRIVAPAGAGTSVQLSFRLR